MFSKVRKHLSFANVMSCIAVFAVLGGGMAVAAGLKKNSVKSKQIAASAVKAAEIAGGAVTTDKLADDAVTGAKADESSFGKVPSAASADTAGTADSATNAQNAQNAQNAASAQNAVNAQQAQTAANATLFGGKTLAQTRTAVSGDSTVGNDPLLHNAFELVSDLSATVPVPAGGGDLIANATVQLQNTSNVQAAPICRLESDGAAISADTMITSPPNVAHHQTITLVGFANNQGAGNETVTVQCNGDSGAADDVVVQNADVNVQVAPIG